MESPDYLSSLSKKVNLENSVGNSDPVVRNSGPREGPAGIADSHAVLSAVVVGGVDLGFGGEIAGLGVGQAGLGLAGLPGLELEPVAEGLVDEGVAVTASGLGHTVERGLAVGFERDGEGLPGHTPTHVANIHQSIARTPPCHPYTDTKFRRGPRGGAASP